MKKITFAKTYPAYLTLGVLLLLSIGAWWFLSNKVEAERKVEFNAAVSSVMQRLDLGVQQQEEVMVSMKSLYKSLVEVVKGVFELYGSIPVETRPYILSISYIPEIQESQKEQFIHNTRGELFSNEFDYKLDQTYTIFPEGSRESYFPITFIVPLSKNVYKCGYDVSQDKNLFATIQKALNSKSISASAIHEVRKDTLGFYLVLKVENKPSPDDSEYDPNNPFAKVKPKSRVIVLEIDAKNFFETILGSKVASDDLVSFEFLDKTTDGSTKRIFTSKGFTEEAMKSSNLHDVETLQLANRTLELHFSSKPNFAAGFANAVPYIVLFGGGFASFLFFGFVYSTITSRARAENLAEEMTRSQRRIVDSSKDIIASLEMNGIWKNMNPASQLLFGMEPANLVGKPIANLIGEHDSAELLALLQQSKDEQTHTKMYHIKGADGVARWVSFHFTVSKIDGLFFAIGRDVTIEKEAEDQIVLRSKQIQLAEQYVIKESQTKTEYMIHLSEDLRDSLSSTIGFLQLLEAQAYETENEKDEFLKTTLDSTEQLLSMMTDINDVAFENKTFKMVKEYVTVKNVIDEAMNIIKTDYPELPKISIEYNCNGEDRVFANKEVFVESIKHILGAMFETVTAPSSLQIEVQPNPHENVMEVQIMTPVNPLASAQIGVFKANQRNIVEAMHLDQNSIVFRLAIAQTQIQRMNGGVVYESFGESDNNLAQIHIPISQFD